MQRIVEQIKGIGHHGLIVYLLGLIFMFMCRFDLGGIFYLIYW
jgi:hypothetical protein